MGMRRETETAAIKHCKKNGMELFRLAVTADMAKNIDALAHGEVFTVKIVVVQSDIYDLSICSAEMEVENQR